MEPQSVSRPRSKNGFAGRRVPTVWTLIPLKLMYREAAKGIVQIDEVMISYMHPRHPDG